MAKKGSRTIPVGVMKRKYRLSTLEQAAKQLDAQLRIYTIGLIIIVKIL